MDLLFTQVPAMRLGLLLLLTLSLGIVVGLLLGAGFPRFQSNWEIKRLRKDIEHLRKEQLNTAKMMAAEAAAHTRHEKTVLDINSNDRPSAPLLDKMRSRSNLLIFTSPVLIKRLLA